MKIGYVFYQLVLMVSLGTLAAVVVTLAEGPPVDRVRTAGFLAAALYGTTQAVLGLWQLARTP